MRFSLARAFDFAHLSGTAATDDETERDLRLINGNGAAAATPPAHAADNQDERKRKDDETDDDYAKRMKKLDEDEAKKSGKKTGEATDDGDGEECDDDPKEEASVRVRKAEARGARKMQQRIGAILSSPSAARNMKLAAKLSCNTQMKADEAIVILEESPVAYGGGLRDRMAQTNTRVPPGSGKPANGEAAVDALWGAALADMIPAKK